MMGEDKRASRARESGPLSSRVITGSRQGPTKLNYGLDSFDRLQRSYPALEGTSKYFLQHAHDNTLFGYIRPPHKRLSDSLAGTYVVRRDDDTLRKVVRVVVVSITCISHDLCMEQPVALTSTRCSAPAGASRS